MSGGEPARILIVDDEVTAVIVVSLGYDVLTAGDTAGALGVIGSQCGIDLLVSDVHGGVRLRRSCGSPPRRYSHGI